MVRQKVRARSLLLGKKSHGKQKVKYPILTFQTNKHTNMVRQKVVRTRFLLFEQKILRVMKRIRTQLLRLKKKSHGKAKK